MSVRPDPLLADFVVPCRDPFQSLIVLYDGRVFACCHPMAHEKMQLGNLATQSVEEIWNGRLYQSLRAGLRSGDAPDICRKCSIVHSPPPVIEDYAELARSPDIAAHYAARDSGREEGSRGDGVLAYVAELREHADRLDEDRTALRAHAQELERMHAEELLRIRALEAERADPRAAIRRGWRALLGGRAGLQDGEA